MRPPLVCTEPLRALACSPDAKASLYPLLNQLKAREHKRASEHAEKELSHGHSTASNVRSTGVTIVISPDSLSIDLNALRV